MVHAADNKDTVIALAFVYRVLVDWAFRSALPIALTLFVLLSFPLF